MNDDSPPVFLTAEWRHLAMLNYEIDPKILAPFVPDGTELDFWNGKTFVSVVGFLFQKTRVCGIPIPFHRNFEEVNLRFYVRRKAEDGWRRAVVFIKEIVPRFAIAFAARAIYNEPYIALPMSHQIEPDSSATAYFWRFKGNENVLKIITRGQPQIPVEGSQPEFIAEHYWGYTAQYDGSTLEYRVEHPRWRIWDSQSAELHCDVAALYGKSFSETFSHLPSSAFLAEGSPVKVYKGIRLK
ncbi:MAG TPA: DUF2071 domain-containing protein [Verrucomicrobiae bacterium]|nr:DUF2071 domain-containing protein [Verrucomicrobiae bacterium]